MAIRHKWQQILNIIFLLMRVSAYAMDSLESGAWVNNKSTNTAAPIAATAQSANIIEIKLIKEL